MDFNDIMKLAGQVRAELSTAQSQAALARVTGEAGGGLVRVVMNGRHEVLEVHVDPTALVASEVHLLEDLVRAAVNQATSKASVLVSDRIAELGRRLGFDPSVLSGGFPGG